MVEESRYRAPLGRRPLGLAGTLLGIRYFDQLRRRSGEWGALQAVRTRGPSLVTTSECSN
jgi:hypothetical protein